GRESSRSTWSEGRSTRGRAPPSPAAAKSVTLISHLSSIVRLWGEGNVINGEMVTLSNGQIVSFDGHFSFRPPGQNAVGGHTITIQSGQITSVYCQPFGSGASAPGSSNSPATGTDQFGRRGWFRQYRDTTGQGGSNAPGQDIKGAAAYGKFMQVFLGLCIWEFATSFPFDGRFISGKSGRIPRLDFPGR
ncbi:hypothetical protein FKP32DRAFT_1670420, partial [Trametes sanguinea]